MRLFGRALTRSRDAEGDDASRPTQGLLHASFMSQALPVLILTAIGGLIAGSVLEGMSDLLASLPGLIVLVPAMIGLRGNINAALGSRLGSAVHLGLIAPSTKGADLRRFFNRELAENVNGSLYLSLIMPGFAAIASYATSVLLGLPTIGVMTLLLIAVFAGVASGVVLAAITVGIVLLAYRYGLDPDNITGPTLATLGDVATLLILFASALVFGGI